MLQAIERRFKIDLPFRRNLRGKELGRIDDRLSIEVQCGIECIGDAQLDPGIDDIHMFAQYIKYT